jgi:hypothetical protein
MMTLDDCRALCLEAKIADPRFFSVEELAKIRSHAKKQGNISDWSIPFPYQWEVLNDSVVGGVFGAFKLYDNPYKPPKMTND